MKILTIHGDYYKDKIGGSERQLYLIEKSLKGKGHSVIHLHAQPQASDYTFFEKVEGIDTYHLGARNSFEKFFYFTRIIDFLKSHRNLFGRNLYLRVS